MVRSKSRAKDKRVKKRIAILKEIDELEKRIKLECPPRTVNILNLNKEEKKRFISEYAAKVQKETNEVKFSDIPISRALKYALLKNGFVFLTEVQKHSIIHALNHRDILASSETGSGKTLSFLIPVLENMYRANVSKNFSLYALILVPTRELGMQIFDVINSLGRYLSKSHTHYSGISVGLIIGGEDFEYEQQRIASLNIIVATPGRILQHFNETPQFTAAGLKMLVIDEADKMLEMGFKETLNKILEELPEDRQTLLFSATQTRSVDKLASLSLKNPQFILSGGDIMTTPLSLSQYYMITPIEKKIEILFGFLRSHTRQKIIIFFATCNQVRFYHLLLKHLRPGIPLMFLHGHIKPKQRVRLFDEFVARVHAKNSTQGVALLATDLVSRGLDFPGVDWVIQFDCPEDKKTYIHRVGRTARLGAKGNSLLFLLESEKKMLDVLAPIKLKETEPNERYIHNITESRIPSVLAEFPNMVGFAQKAISSYLKSVNMSKNKEVFDVSKIDIAAYARSCGLTSVPRIKRIKKKVGSKEKVFNKPFRVSKDLELVSKVDDLLGVDTVKITKEEEDHKEESSESESMDVLVPKAEPEHLKEILKQDSKEYIRREREKVLEAKLLEAKRYGVILPDRKFRTDDKLELVEVEPTQPVDEKLIDEYLQQVREEVQKVDEEDKRRYRERIKKEKLLKKLKRKGKTFKEDQEAADGAIDEQDSESVSEEDADGAIDEQEGVDSSTSSGSDSEDHTESGGMSIEAEERLILQMMEEEEKKRKQGGV